MNKQSFHKSAAKVIAASLIVMLALAALPAKIALADSQTLTTSGNWTVPAGVTSITVECWGGGGGGASVSSNNTGGGGGGGGAYSKINTYSVTPGTVIPYTIGGAGNAGSNGGTTTFNSTICVAAGGSGTTTATGGAGGADGTGDAHFPGGYGYTWSAGAYGAGGGGSAGTLSAGNNATATVATTFTGAVAVTGGGPGGNGANGAGNGSAPSSAPGGGGGGAYRTNQNRTGGAGYRGQIIITYTPPPTLSSPTATAIASITATLGANITSTGGGSITQYGTCWALSAGPTLLNGATCSAKGAGAAGVFTDSVIGLNAGTKIYYRGYATNSAGTGYSPDGSFFTEPATQAAIVPFSAVLSTSMTVNWTRGSGEGVIVVMRAGTAVNSDPVDGNYSYNGVPAFGSGTQIGTGNYVVYKGPGTSVNVTALTAGTTYYVAIYEYAGQISSSGVNQGTNYLLSPATGSQATPANLPSLTSPTATAITSTTATLGANITATGGAPITQYGTCWGLSQPLTLLTGTCSTKGAGAVGVFTDSVVGLTAGAHIFHNGYATNSGGTGYSPDGSFYTEPATQASGVNFTVVSGTGMTINWSRGTAGDGVIVLMKAGSAITGVPADGTFTTYNASTTYGNVGSLLTDAYIVFKGAGTSQAVTGLTPGTTYYVAVFEYKGEANTSGVNQGTNYKLSPATGSQLTPTMPPTVTTGAVTGRKRTSAILNGTVNPNGSSTTVTFVYGPASNPGLPPYSYPYTITADQSPVTGILAVAVSGSIPGGLTPNTPYWYRAVGTNGAGTVYGTEMTFTTLTAGSTNWYVNKNNAACNDTTGGTTSALPFCTIGAAADVADAGDNVNVLAGSYAETVKPAFNGGAGMPITFTASPGVIVTGRPDAPANATSGGAFRLTNKGYIIVDGFTITGTVDNAIRLDTSNHITISNNHVSLSGKTDNVANNRNGIYLTSATYSTIKGNTTDHNSLDGIRLANGSNFNEVSNNISYSNSTVLTRQATGINVISNSHDNTILHNIVYLNEDTGLNFYTGANHNFVVGNLSYANGDHGIDNNGAPANMFIGNTVVGNVTVGINLEEDTPFTTGSGGATLANNVSVDNGYLKLENGQFVTGSNPGNIRVDSSSIAGTTLDYDLVYSSPAYTGVQIIWGIDSYTTMDAFKGSGQELHGLQANPLLANPAEVAQRPAAAPYTIKIPNPNPTTPYDYHILTGSPAIDSANSGAPHEAISDLDGKPRVDILTVPNTGVGVDDRGAYEYQLPGTQVITFTSTAPTNAVVGGPTYTPTATGGASGNPVTFTIDPTTSTICSIGVANAVSFTAVGTCKVNADQAGNAQYSPAPQVSQSFAVGMGSQVITFTSTAPTTAVVAGPTYTPTATGGASLNPVTFTIDPTTSTVCSIGVANAISFTAVGTCKVNADQLGNTNYNAATQVSQSFAVGKGNQVITFTSTAPTTAVVAGPTYTPTATGGASLNPVTFTIDPTSSAICSINLGVVSFTGAGTCKINADQLGDTNYNPAVQASQSFAVGKGSQTITFTSTAPTTAVAGGPTYTPTATGGASLNPVTFTIDPTSSSICSINLGVVSFTGAGTCKINADQLGNTNYNPATQVSQSFAVGKGEQTIAITTHVPASAAYLSSFTVAATATSGLPVAYSATGVCSNVGATFTMTSAAGICTVHFKQLGDSNFNAAPEITEDVTARGYAQVITILIHAPATANFLSSFTVSATADSNLPVAYTASGACTNIGATFTMTRAFGICTVHYNQAGDSNYASAPELFDIVSARGNVLYLPMLRR
jgi:parallel beta-helix repeat protein